MFLFCVVTSSIIAIVQAPSGSVQGLISEQVNFTSIVLSWQPLECLEQNSPITNYSIQYSENGYTSGPISTTGTSFVAASLFPSTLYTFEVFAVNQHGKGPSANYTLYTKTPKGMFIIVYLFNFFQSYILHVYLDFLLFKGLSYSNNSIIAINDIGLDSDALFCFTNVSDCCRTEDNSMIGDRSWYDPKGNIISSNATSRGPQCIILQHTKLDIISGIYKCQIHNEMNYVGLYPSTEGICYKTTNYFLMII